MRICVTGGAGYIGSHTVIELLAAGHEVIVIDNLDNSSAEAIRRVEEISGKQVQFHEVDLLDKDAVDEIFAENAIEAVIHFAGLKAVGESVSEPLRYYHNNITGGIYLCEVMAKHGVKNIVFSSSATVYGESTEVCYTEDLPTNPVNPYGRTKLMYEEILTDLHASDPEWNVVLLRYFNPIGAHKSGKIGEDPNGIPNNLVPYIAQVAVGKLEALQVFGDDYPTPDGTGIRDYIHVVDLADGHVSAVDKLKSNPGVVVYNLGTGEGTSVLEVVEAFREASGQEIPIKIVARRAGDLAENYADPSLAEKELDWKATRGIREMCEDTWRWQSGNPNGYKEETGH